MQSHFCPSCKGELQYDENSQQSICVVCQQSFTIHSQDLPKSSTLANTQRLKMLSRRGQTHSFRGIERQKRKNDLNSSEEPLPQNEEVQTSGEKTPTFAKTQIRMPQMSRRERKNLQATALEEVQISPEEPQASVEEAQISAEKTSAEVQTSTEVQTSAEVQTPAEETQTSTEVQTSAEEAQTSEEGETSSFAKTQIRMPQMSRRGRKNLGQTQQMGQVSRKSRPKTAILNKSDITRKSLRQTQRISRRSRPKTAILNKSDIVNSEGGSSRVTRRISQHSLKPKVSVQQIFAITFAALIVIVTIVWICIPKSDKAPANRKSIRENFAKMDNQPTKKQKPFILKERVAEDSFYNLTLSEIRELPEDQMDFAWTALLVAQDDFLIFRKPIKVHKFINEIATLAAHIQQKIDDQMSEEEVIQTINQYLYTQEKFQTSQIGWDPSNLYLNLILEGRQAYCLGFVELWVAITERLQWRGAKLPIRGVGIPRHVFCRWDSDQYKRNIETLHVPPEDWKPSESFVLSQLFKIPTEEKIPYEAGRNLSDSYYKEMYGIPDVSVEKGIHLKTLGKRALISFIYSNRAGLRLDRLEYANKQKKRHDILNKAISDLQEASLWYPNNMNAKKNQAITHLYYQAMPQKAIDILTPIEELIPSCAVLSILAVAHIKLRDYEKAEEYIAKAEKAKAFDEDEKLRLPLLRAEILYDQKQYKEALEYCKECFYGDVETSQTDLMLFMIKVKNKLGELDSALRLALFLYRVHGESTRSMAALAEVHKYRKEWEKAKDLYENVLLYDDQNTTALNGMGEYWLSEKKLEKAKKCFQQVLTYDPNHEEAKENLDKLNK